MITKEKILELINSRQYRPLKTKEMLRRLSASAEEHSHLESLLDALQQAGEIVQLSNGGWDRPERNSMLVGHLDHHPRGFGFVIPVSASHDEDVFITERQLGGAMDGDLVVVRYRPGKKTKKDKGPSGSVVRVLERAHTNLVGTFHSTRGKNAGAVTPDEPSLETDVLIPCGSENNARDGEKVLVEITHWPDPRKGHARALGNITRVLGTENTPEIDELSIIHQFNLPEEFPGDVAREAEKIPFEPGGEVLRNRRDLSGILTIAVDPEDAKDCDDALSMFVDPGTGHHVVMVHIADVSCYVKPGSLLDREAFKRALSVYLVRSFIPMIPQEATQQKLSLAAGRNRAAKTVELHFDNSGGLLSSKIFHSIVQLDAQMSYKQVQGILEEDEKSQHAQDPHDERECPEEIKELVRNLDELARKLRAGRQRVGSVDLDVPEYDVNVGDDGRVEAVSQIERDRSHSLVEEFMLAANVAVACFLQEKKLPGIYRIHEEPDPEDLDAFADFIKTVLKREIDPYDRGAIQQLLIDVRETNFAEAVNMELLRCMKRAQYSVECSPHFALHFSTYCHFTSPIRRYPDLVVHQILDAHFGGKLKKQQKTWSDAKLAPIARHCTLTEETADKAEREMIKLKLLRFLQERGIAHGEVFDGVITGVKEFGFFAQLQEFSIEGMVRVNKLKGDYYEYQAGRRALVGRKKGRTFRLGQPVKVKIDHIDMAQRRLDFDLAG